MEIKKYVIVNSFQDIYTGEDYSTNHEPVEFDEKRVEEIRNAEKVLGYKLIEEYKVAKKENKDKKESKKEIKEEINN